MGTNAAIHAKRVENARRAMHGAMVTIQNASLQAMAAAPTVERQAAIAEATEYALAAIKGMARAVGPDWQELAPRAGQ